MYNSVKKDGDLVDIIERLDFILKKYGWTRYRLSKESGLSESTLANIFHRGTVPTISTLEIICKAMNISLADFFADDERVVLTPELKELYEAWAYLSPEKKDHIIKTIKYMK